MSNKPIRVFLPTGVLLLGLLSAACATNENDTVVKLSDLPPAAQKAIQTQLAGGKLDEITKTTEDEGIIYDVEMTREGRTRSFTINAEGDLLEVEVFLRETPRPVQEAIHAQVGDGKLGEITKSTEAGELTYDVEMTKEGKTRDFTVGQDGKLRRMQVFLQETPPEIQKAIQKEVGNGKCGDIYKATEDGEVLYDVEITKDGKTHSLTFDKKGVLVF